MRIFSFSDWFFPFLPVWAPLVSEINPLHPFPRYTGISLDLPALLFFSPPPVFSSPIHNSQAHQLPLLTFQESWFFLRFRTPCSVVVYTPHLALHVALSQSTLQCTFIVCARSQTHQICHWGERAHPGVLPPAFLLLFNSHQPLFQQPDL